MIDSHAHLDAPEFAGQGMVAYQEAQTLGVRGILIPAVCPDNFIAVQELANSALGAGFTLGIHPMYVESLDEAHALSQLNEAVAAALTDARFVGIGEIGLDYFVPGLDREKQLRMFQAQLRLARDLELPVVMHVRRSADHIARECRRFGIKHGVAHAFNGSEQQAHALIKQGLCLGFGGAFTYGRALQLRRLAQHLPLDCLVLETDAPDIAPVWLAGEFTGQPNSPVQLPRIAACLALLRQESLALIQEQTTQNVVRSVPRMRSLVRPA
jgi:TatD DNase family protein